MQVDDEKQYDIEKIRRYSTEDIKEPEVRKRTLSIMIERLNGN